MSSKPADVRIVVHENWNQHVNFLVTLTRIVSILQSKRLCVELRSSADKECRAGGGSEVRDKLLFMNLNDLPNHAIIILLTASTCYDTKSILDAFEKIRSSNIQFLTLAQNIEVSGAAPGPIENTYLMDKALFPGCIMMRPALLRAAARRYPDLCYKCEDSIVCGLSHPFISAFSRIPLFDWMAFYHRLITAEISPLFGMPPGQPIVPNMNPPIGITSGPESNEDSGTTEQGDATEEANDANNNESTENEPINNSE